VIAILVTTWLHYRQKRKLSADEEDQVPSVVRDIWAGSAGNAGNIRDDEDQDDEEGRNKVYRGILWMKEKYEQYREQADKRYEQLKEDLRKSEEKYQELLVAQQNREVSEPASTREVALIEAPSKDRSYNQMPAEGFISEEMAGELIAEKDKQIGFLQVQLAQRIKNYHHLEYQRREENSQMAELRGQYQEAQQSMEAQQQLLRDSRQSLNEHQQSLEESRSTIEQLNERLQREAQKVKELSGKLETNSRLFMHIYKELDQSLSNARELPDIENLKAPEGVIDFHPVPINGIAFG